MSRVASLHIGALQVDFYLAEDLQFIELSMGPIGLKRSFTLPRPYWRCAIHIIYTFVLTFLYSFYPVAFASRPDQHLGRIDSWLELYAHRTIVGAYNKTGGEPIDIRRSHDSVQELPQLDRREISAILKYSAASGNPRHRAIVNNISEVVRRASIDELVIIFTGAAHALDLFMSDIFETDLAYYSFPPLRDDLKFADTYQELMRIFSSVETSEKSKEIEKIGEMLKVVFQIDSPAETRRSVSEMIRLGIIFHSHNKKNPLSVEKRSKLLERLINAEAANGRPKAIVFADVHGLESNPQISTFPFSHVATLGYKKVTFLLESFPYGVSISQEEIEIEPTLFGQLRKDLAFFRFISDLDGSLVDLISESQFIVFPSATEIAKLARSFKELGLEVQIQGIEETALYEEAVANQTDFLCRSLLSR